MSSHWYVLRSKPHKESFLHGQLNAHKIDTYYPVIRVKPVNPRARKAKPLFPGYLFVHIDLAEIELSTLKWMPGSIGLVSFEEIPSRVPDSVINAIQKQVDALNSADRQLHQFEKGDQIIVQAGPFSGYRAVFDMRLSGEERVLVLLQLLQNQNIRLSLSPDQIKKMS